MAKDAPLSQRNGNQFVVPVVSLLLWLFFLVGLFLPDQWWGTHYAAFLPEPWPIVLLGASLLLISPPSITSKRLAALDRKNTGWGNEPSNTILASQWGIPLLLATGFAILAYHLRIVDDNYGDAGNYLEFINHKVEQLEPGFWGDLFSLDITAGQGRKGALQLVTLIAYWTGTTYREAFCLLGAFSAFGYALLWARFAMQRIPNRSSQFILLTIALAAPLVQVFFGHNESYSLVFFLLTAWFMSLWTWLRTNSYSYLVINLLLLLIAIRFHSLSLLLVPGLLISLSGRYLRRKQSRFQWTSRNTLLFAYLPLALLGILAYFFIFKDHADPRTMGMDVETSERTFLPILTPEPPLDRYHLFHPNHLFDLLNILVFWAPAGLLLLASLLTRRRDIKWNDPALTSTLLTLLLVCSAFCAINPLLSMPMDFDLFCFPGMVLILFIAILLAKSPPEGRSRLVPPIFGLALLTIPVLWVNSESSLHSQRLQSVAVHVYKTYYAHSDRFLSYSLIVGPLDDDTYLARQKDFLDKVKSSARPGIDTKYRDLLIDRGMVLLMNKNDETGAQQAISEAATYAPLDMKFTMDMMERSFRRERFDLAHFWATFLIKEKYPDEGKALRIGIHTAIEAGKYPEALGYSQTYLSKDPANSFIRTVEERLRTNTGLDSLKYLFSR